MRTSTSTGVSPSGVAPHANLAHNWRNSKLCWLNEEEILKTLKTVVQRLGGRDYGQEPSGLRHCFICDTSRMYAERTEPRPNTAAILQATTCWSRLEVVDQTAHQQFQKVGDSMQLIAQATTTRSTFISKELPANPKMAMEMFLDLVARQSNHGNPVLEKFISSMKRYMEVFTQLGHQQFTDSLPEPQPRYQTSKPPPTLQVLKTFADGSSSTQVTELMPVNVAPSATDTNIASASLKTTAPNSSMAPDNVAQTVNITLEQTEQAITQMEVANIEAELSALTNIDRDGSTNEDIIRLNLEDNQ